MTLHRTISDFTDNKSIWNWYINSVGRLNLSQWRPCVCAVYVTWHFPLGWVDDWWMVFFLPMTIVAISQWHATAPQWMGGRDRCRTYYYQAPVRHGPKKLCDLGCGVFKFFYCSFWDLVCLFVLIKGLHLIQDEEVHRNPKQKEFLKSSERFLRAVLTGHGHPSPFWKIAKMALFNPCM